MDTFTAYFKKEILESSRQYRYLVLGIGILLFAVLDPVMLKLLPSMMKGQLPVDISSLFVITQRYSMQNYVKDLFQVGNLFVTLSLMGVISDELAGGRLVFPYSKGARPWEIVLAKLIHYSLVISLFIFAGFAINYYYASILFAGDYVSAYRDANSAILIALYYEFNVSLIIFLSSIFRKGLAAGIVSLTVSYFMPLLTNIDWVKDFVPYTLINTASTFKAPGESIQTTILSSIILIIILTGAAIYKLNKTDAIQR